VGKEALIVVEELKDKKQEQDQKQGRRFKTWLKKSLKLEDTDLKGKLKPNLKSRNQNLKLKLIKSKQRFTPCFKNLILCGLIKF